MSSPYFPSKSPFSPLGRSCSSLPMFSSALRSVLYHRNVWNHLIQSRSRLALSLTLSLLFFMMRLGSLFADFAWWAHLSVHTGLYLQLSNILLHDIFHFSSTSFVVDSILGILIIYMCFFILCFPNLSPSAILFKFLSHLFFLLTDLIFCMWLCFCCCVFSFLAFLPFWMHLPFHLTLLIFPSCDFLLLCFTSHAFLYTAGKVNDFLNFSSEFCSILFLEVCSSSDSTEWCSHFCTM